MKTKFNPYVRAFISALCDAIHASKAPLLPEGVSFQGDVVHVCLVCVLESYGFREVGAMVSDIGDDITAEKLESRIDGALRDAMKAWEIANANHTLARYDEHASASEVETFKAAMDLKRAVVTSIESAIAKIAA